MHSLILGVNGKLGSGKDSFADFAVEKYGYKKLSFANALKNEVKDFFEKYSIHYEDKNIWGSQSDKEEELIIENIDSICKSFFPLTDLRQKISGKKTTFRYILQWWGTDYRREMCDQNYWVKKFIEECSQYEKVVCSDLRFPNEYNAIKDNHGICIKVIRDNSFQSNTAFHISETALDHIDDWYSIIDNNSTLDDYYLLCDKILIDIEEKFFLLENWRI